MKEETKIFERSIITTLCAEEGRRNCISKDYKSGDCTKSSEDTVKYITAQQLRWFGHLHRRYEGVPLMEAEWSPHLFKILSVSTEEHSVL